MERPLFAQNSCAVTLASINKFIILDEIYKAICLPLLE